MGVGVCILFYGYIATSEVMGSFGVLQWWGFGCVSQDVLQWYRDYFELKAILALGSRETLVFPFYL